MFVCNLVEYLYAMLHVRIKGNYGHASLSKTQYKKKLKDGTLTPEEKRDFHEPGPFSLVTYLKAFLEKGFYGDEITLVLMSMMWQIRITVLQAESQIQTKIRHSNTLALTDMVLVRTSRLHYFPACKYIRFYLTCAILHPISCKCTMSVLCAPH